MTKTIHAEIREKVEVAFIYAEDGAMRSAARVLREAADMYEKRAAEIDIAIVTPNH